MGGFKKYFQNAAWIFAGKILTLVVAFFTNIYVVRFLGPSQYGLLSYSVSFVGLFSFIASLGIDSILYRDLIKYPEKRDELLGSTFFLKLTGSFLALFLIVLILPFTDNNLYTAVLILIIAFSLIFQPFNVINLYFQSRLLSKYPSIISLAIVAILSILKIIFVIIKVNLIYFAIIFLAEAILTMGALIWVYRRQQLKIFNWRWNFRLGRQILSNSWPFALSGAFILVYNRIDQVFIKHLIDATAVGIYDVAVRLSELWYFIPMAIVGSLFPAIVNAKKIDEQLYRRRLIRLYSLTIYLGLAIIIPFVLASDWIIGFLYGSHFLGAAAILRIYIWSGMAVSIGIVINFYLLNENYIKISFYSNLVGMLSNVLLNIILIPLYGISGAAFATLISYSLVPLSALLFKVVRNQGVLIFKGLLLKNK